MIQKAERIIEAYQKVKPAGCGVIAMDGRAAAGKTTLAEELAVTLGGAVVHMDDFFLPGELRTPERLAAPGGNVHAERFAEEVLPFLRRGAAFRYSQHPRFGGYADLTVFCDIAPEEQKRRITARNGEEHWMVFREQWIPLEEKYLAEYHIKENAMLTV